MTRRPRCSASSPRPPAIGTFVRSSTCAACSSPLRGSLTRTGSSAMSSSSDARSPVELLADEFLARCKRGERPTIREYCDQHPDLADEIRDVFEAVLMVEDLRHGSDDVSGSVGESVLVGGKRLQQVGDYRILGVIGRGGMGVVYEAEQQALGRRVALKVLPRTIAGDGSAQIRFQREAKAAARMHHTNIVPVFDVGQDGEHLYYAMQVIHGQGLDLVLE